ncbi:MAG: long-chain-acyl-CoA synthetase [Myxococcales bacterium]|nr:long-chain-acyl-CoA synthetase [Myxococcales bacterium]
MPSLNPEQLRETAAAAQMMSRAVYYSMVKLRDTSGLTPVRLVERWAAEQPNNLAIVSDDGTYSYRAFDRRANAVARVLRQAGATKGESVALMMDSRPEYLFSIIGAAKLGMATGLINTNLTGAQLEHALRITDARWIIVGSEHLAAVKAVLGRLDLAAERVLVWDDPKGKRVRHPKGSTDLAAAVADASGDPVERADGYDMKAPFVYICTSGTTGMPKAALVRNQRYLQASYYFGQAVLRVQPSDVMYTSGLPLYHNTGISQAWGVALTGGAAVALRRRFSASAFWDDCDRFDVTMFTYVGEVCRYLVNASPHPKERSHRVRCVLGAGLRPDIWEAFERRFQVGQIYEYYGATEGNVGLINLTGRPGMVGRIAPARGHVLAKVDPETEELVRGPEGTLVAAGVGESGILLAKIGPMAEFEGYVDKSKNASKVLENPFGQGDRYFNTGDMLTLHEGNWVSFADRLGDTFRWKGENVSTNDVQETVSRAEGVDEANAYGVQVPGCDGRAGMVAVTTKGGFDPDALARHVVEHLPAYARPLFVRVEDALQMTGSYKYVKTGLKADGFDPSKIASPLYFLHPDKRTYVPLDAAGYEAIVSGAVRV